MDGRKKPAAPRFAATGTARISTERRRQLEREAEVELLRLDLQAICELAGKTPQEAAAAAGLSERDISRLEPGTDQWFGLVRRFVRALGGELEVVARFGNKRLTLRRG